MRFHTEARKFAAMQIRGTIVADLAYVAGAEAPLLAGNDRTRGLASREDLCRAKFNLGAAEGEVGQGDYGVCCVQPDADEVNLRRFRHIFTVNEFGRAGSFRCICPRTVVW